MTNFNEYCFYRLKKEFYLGLATNMKSLFDKDEDHLNTVYIFLGQISPSSVIMQNLTTKKRDIWSKDWFIMSKKHSTKLGKIIYNNCS